MRILFVGAIKFSLSCLNAVINAGGDVIAVLTLPENRAGFHSDYAELAPTASEHGIPCFHLQKPINYPENAALIHSLRPDVVFVFGWSELVSKEILKIPPLGCIGTHPALLPKNRGRHPLIWALVEGLEQSGLTFLYLDEGPDSGDILWQSSFDITLEDDAASLYEKMKCMAVSAIGEFLPLLEKGIAPRKSQDHAQATYWRKRTESDGEIHWDKPTMAAYNLIRALTRPYVGAHTSISGRKMFIWRSRLPEQTMLSKGQSLLPGEILRCGSDGIDVRTGDGYLTLLEYELPQDASLREGAVLGN